MEIKIKLKQERAKKSFQRLANRIDDMSPIWKKFIKFWQTDLMPKTWDSRGKTFGEQWESLSPAYAKWKRKHGGKRLMELTSRLFEAVKGGSGWFEKVEKKKFTIGVSGEEYFYHVQERGKKGRRYFTTKDGDMPNRAWGFIIKSVSEYLEEADNDR